MRLFFFFLFPFFFCLRGWGTIFLVLVTIFQNHLSTSNDYKFYKHPKFFKSQKCFGWKGVHVPTVASAIRTQELYFSSNVQILITSMNYHMLDQQTRNSAAHERTHWEVEIKEKETHDLKKKSTTWNGAIGYVTKALIRLARQVPAPSLIQDLASL